MEASKCSNSKSAAAEGTPARLLSLDVFRGLTILGMLLVNNIALGGAAPAQLTHAAWNKGVYFADLVFPWFLFIVGVAIPYSATSFKRRGNPNRKYYAKALNRAVVLVLLGCLVDSSIAKTPVLGLGVLQIIGLAYFVAALTAYRPVKERAALAGIFLLLHWAAIRFVPVPGMSAGSFLPDANLISYLNKTHLQPLHLAGIVSVVPTAALVITGSLAGELLRSRNITGNRKALYLSLWGSCISLAGWLWNLDLPFNKPVWTPSYILLTAGLGLAALGILFWIIDVKGLKSWAFPATVAGMNAIAAYVAPILVKVYILQGWQYKLNGVTASLQDTAIAWCVTHAGRIPGGWMYTLGYILFWWIILFWMYRKKIFLKI